MRNDLGFLEVVGTTSWMNVSINTYGDLNRPWYVLADVAKIVGYRMDNAHRLKEFCEPNEIAYGRVMHGRQTRVVLMVNYYGMLNILAQMRTVEARKWRILMIADLERMREEAKRTVPEQFEYWEDAGDDIWYDDETGKFMEAFTVPGGDVEIREYKPY